MAAAALWVAIGTPTAARKAEGAAPVQAASAKKAKPAAGAKPVAAKPADASAIAALSLPDHHGKKRAWSDLVGKKGTVAAFVGVECPLAKQYTQRLQELAKQYAGQGVAFVAIDSNTQDSLAELAVFARDRGWTGPLLKDADHAAADAFGATRTPEVFLLDAAGQVRYQGRVDDQYGIGFIRNHATTDDLKAALDELLAGKSVTTPRTEPVGCLIGRTRKADAASATKVTYAKDIAPIVHKQCVECHRPGEIGPFSLLDPADALPWAEMILEVVQERRMPPWHADPKHGKFAEDRRLPQADVDLIAQWVEAGAPLGNEADLPQPPTFLNTGWQLPRDPDLVVKMRDVAFDVPAEGAVRYQFFVADPGLKEDKWLEAVEVRPGNRAVVHHVLVFAKTAAGGDEGEGREGFLAAYVPGLRARPYPKGMAKKLPAGAKLVFQMHYTPIGTPQEDMSELGLLFADPEKIDFEVKTVSASQPRLSIPAGDGNFKVTAASSAAPIEVQLLCMSPHMHLRGKAFRYEAVYDDGRRETLLDIPAYDFNWQTTYRLAEPLKLPPGAKLVCEAAFDNSSENPNNPDPSKTVKWGPQTWDEMMIGYFDIAFPIGTKASMKGGRPGAGAAAGAIRDRLVDSLDKNNDGKLTREEVPERFKAAFDRIVKPGEKSLTVEEVKKRLAK